ncbi:hypothetical protein BREVNS_0899 [Brevinematales bacterium NS]|nr:hypothetical protein BREVNS_0899 [Brevinematales bacterium NS]
MFSCLSPWKTNLFSLFDRARGIMKDFSLFGARDTSCSWEHHGGRWL